MKNNKQIDSYIAQFPEGTQTLLKQLRKIIQENAHEAEEAISYGMPTYKLNGNLVHFAAYENHIGFYPTPSAIEGFKTQLSKYKTSKGAVQFPLDEALPLDLIEKIVRFRVKENCKIYLQKK